MRIIDIIITRGKQTTEFTGFPAGECDHEEDVIRALLGRFGVETTVECEDKKEAQYNGISEREKCKS